MDARAACSDAKPQLPGCPVAFGASKTPCGQQYLATWGTVRNIAAGRVKSESGPIDSKGRLFNLFRQRELRAGGSESRQQNQTG